MGQGEDGGDQGGSDQEGRFLKIRSSTVVAFGCVNYVLLVLVQ